MREATVGVIGIAFFPLAVYVAVDAILAIREGIESWRGNLESPFEVLEDLDHDDHQEEVTPQRTSAHSNAHRSTQPPADRLHPPRPQARSKSKGGAQGRPTRGKRR